MRYTLPLKGEFMDAYLSMPKTAEGLVISLFCVPPGQVAAYEAQWRDWLAKTPKRLWPNWVEAWAAKRKLEAGRAAA